MKKTEIIVYTKLNDIEENNKFYAIKDENTIKYYDLENNKMIIDLKNNKIIRENSDYIFNIDFDSNKIHIYMRKLGKNIIKDIKTIIINNSKKEFMVRYLLTDDEIINEYYVKF